MTKTTNRNSLTVNKASEEQKANKTEIVKSCIPPLKCREGRVGGGPSGNTPLAGVPFNSKSEVEVLFDRRYRRVFDNQTPPP